MQRMERYRGHFYNWYDTRTLQPLIPHYISSVDSGNLAGHLLTLSVGLREFHEAKILHPHLFEGLRDTAGVLRQWVTDVPDLDQLHAEFAKSPTSLERPEERRVGQQYRPRRARHP